MPGGNPMCENSAGSKLRMKRPSPPPSDCLRCSGRWTPAPRSRRWAGGWFPSPHIRDWLACCSPPPRRACSGGGLRGPITQGTSDLLYRLMLLEDSERNPPANVDEIAVRQVQKTRDELLRIGK